MEDIEFWPDYGPGPLWRAGKPVDPVALGLSRELAARLTAWHRQYEEDRIPVEGSGDPGWLEEGRQLLAEVRREAGERFTVIVTEPWWDEEPVDPGARAPLGSTD